MSEAKATSRGAEDVSLSLRPARLDDAPALEALLAAAGLPARRVAEFIDGFLVAEQEGRVVAGGGIELYDATALLRSVVIDEALRGRGLGREIAERLMENARRAGARDLYLFTIDSAPFWKRLGFVDIPMSEWPAATQRCRQFQFVSANLEEFRARGIHSMWRAA